MRTWTRFAAAVVLLPGLLQAAPGELDPTFVYPAPATLVPDSTNLVQMTSGYLVVTSRLTSAAGADATLELTRIDANGARIESFGLGGRKTSVLPGPLNVATATAVLANESLLLAGYKQVGSDDDSVAAIVRLTPDGTLDPTFGEGGLVILDTPGQLDRVAEIQPLMDGRIAAVVWSRLDAPAAKCWSDRTALWYLSGNGHEIEEVSAIERTPAGTTGCRAAVNLRADWDDQDFYRVLWGNSVAMRDGADPYVTGSSGPYGPFTYFWYDPTYYSQVQGNAFELRGGRTPSPPGTYVHANLAAVAGFEGAITWTKLVWNGSSLFAAFSTDGGQVAVIHLATDGYLDKRWGAGNGVAVVTGAGRPVVAAPGGLAKDIRYLGVTDAGVVVATADGVIQRLFLGNEILGGVVALKLGHASYSRALRTIPVKVERSGDKQGAASVQYEVQTSTCGPPVNCRADYSPAQPDQDFVAQQGQVSWADGEGGEKTITVTVMQQSFPQPNETLAVRIYNPIGTRIANNNVVLLLESSSDGSSSGSGDSGGGGATGWATLLLLGGLAACHRRRWLTAR